MPSFLLLFSFLIRCYFVLFIVVYSCLYAIYLGFRASIMIFILIILSMSFFLYSSLIFYSINLIIFTLISLSFMVQVGHVSSLLIGLIMIVYFGAMIILIGYICAVSPNFYSYSSNFRFTVIFLVLFLLFLFLSSMFYAIPSSPVSMFHFFYQDNFLIMVFIIVMLFITLLIVTSQYLTPKGPFRSF